MRHGCAVTDGRSALEIGDHSRELDDLSFSIYRELWCWVCRFSDEVLPKLRCGEGVELIRWLSP